MIKQEWNIDRGLLFATLSLTAFGLVMIFNSSIPISLDRFHKPHFLFYRQLLWTAGGLILFAVATQLPLRLLKKRGIIITIILFTYGLLAATFTQAPINGTYRWIHAGGFSFQPSELAKLVTIIFLAWYFSRYPDLKDHPWRHLFRIVLVIAPMMALIIKEPDLGNALMILGITAILLFFAGFPIKHMLFTGFVSVLVIIATVLMSPYMMQRLITFLDPSTDPLGKGYQINQSLIAVGHSGFWGLGLGQSTQKLFFLPEPHTDFIYAVVAEEIGFLGCALIALLIGYLFLRGMKISLNSPSSFLQWLGAGAVSLILLQTLVNTSMVISLLPTKGIPLPFISMGGSSLIICLLVIGIVINISREVPEC